MNLTDRAMSAYAGLGAFCITGGLLAAVLVWTERAPQESRDSLDHMLAIEASLAMKKTATKQPQKRRASPPPVAEPEGVKRDEAAPPRSDPEPKTEERKPDPSDIPTRASDEEEGPGTPTPTGPTSGSGDPRGFAEVDSGDPFFRQLAADFHESWEFPKILTATGTAAGCVKLRSDGTVERIEVNPRSGDEVFDDSIERALKKIQKLRNDQPVAIPTDLVETIMTQMTGWICFKANAKAQPPE